MTLQYDQDNINLRDGIPISVLTPDITPVLVTLDVLTGDGQSLTVQLYGGGSAPGALTLNNYNVDIGAGATFIREAGAGLVTAGPLALIQVGGPVVLTYVLDDVTTPGSTICQLSIVGPAFDYAHRLKVSKIRF